MTAESSDTKYLVHHRRAAVGRLARIYEHSSCGPEVELRLAKYRVAGKKTQG